MAPNPSPVRSNEKLLKPEKEIENEILKAPDFYKREDYNFFSPNRSVASEEKEQSNDDVSVFDNDEETDETASMATNETNAKMIDDDEEFEIIPVKKKSAITRVAEFFSPKPNELVTVHPEPGPQLTALALAQRDINTQTQTEYLEIPWKKMGRPEKRQWALENASGYESAAVINKMQLKDLDVIRAKVLSGRK